MKSRSFGFSHNLVLESPAQRASLAKQKPSEMSCAGAITAGGSRTVTPAGTWLCKLMWILLVSLLGGVTSTLGIRTPTFSQLLQHYPGYALHGGRYHNHEIVQTIGCETSGLLRDTSALRLSAALNGIGGEHSLGTQLIRLSRYGRDSVTGLDGLQYIYHPIAYGPYFADKYGYPNVSKVNENDLLSTKKTFWGKQGVLRVITYPQGRNLPKGHVALWNCNHFHQSRDWIRGHKRITVEFWESPDSDCSTMPAIPESSYHEMEDFRLKMGPDGRVTKVRHHRWEKRFIKKYHQLHKMTNDNSEHHGAL